MNDQERLENICPTGFTNKEEYVVKIEDHLFLQEKVERAIELETENKLLRSVISSCRCPECGDELGVEWRRVSGTAFCRYCSEEMEGDAE